MWGNLRLSAVPSAGRATRVARVQRTTTTAALLVTVAVSALSGCVTVHRPSVAPGPPATPAGPAEHPEQHASPQVVQAPAQEALHLIESSAPSGGVRENAEGKGSSRGGDADGGGKRRGERPAAAEAAPAPGSGSSDAGRRTASGSDAHPRTRPERRTPPASSVVPLRPHRPHVELPDITRPLPATPNVCALGEQYGGWERGGPASRNCERTYGRR